MYVARVDKKQREVGLGRSRTLLPAIIGVVKAKPYSQDSCCDVDLHSLARLCTLECASVLASVFDSLEFMCSLVETLSSRLWCSIAVDLFFL